MDRKQIITEIRHYLQKISQITSLIENYENSNASVELDLFQKNLSQLFELYVRLKLTYEENKTGELKNTDFLTPEIKVPEFKIAAETEKPKPVEVKPAPEEKKRSFGFNFNLGDDEGKINQRIDTPEFTKAPEKKETAFNLEQAINEALNIAIKNTTEKPKEPAPVVNTPEPEKANVSLNELFSSGKKEVNLAEKHTSTPITDLSKEINLNRKFAFVNDLFKGNMDNYNTSIQQLNSIGSWEAAQNYLAGISSKLQWHLTQKTADDFTDFVKRRWSN